MRRLMNNRTRTFGKSVAMSATALFLAAGAAFAADVPLSVLNAGPSSASIPGLADDRVATLGFPRQIVDLNVPYNLAANLNNNALTVEDSSDPTVGVRNRSRAFISFFDTNVNNTILLQANLNFNAVVADSFILFLNQADAQNITTLGQLDAFVGNAASQFVRYDFDNAAFGLNAGDLDDNLLNVGVPILPADILAATPDAGPAALLNPGAAGNFELAIVVFVNGADRVATEYICVRNGPELVRPIAAASVGPMMNAQVDTIVVVASEQLVDDNALNPMMTDPGALTGADFRVRRNGAGPAVLLTDFLANNLNVANSIAGFAISGDTNEVIEIALNATAADAGDIALIRASTIGFTAGGTGGQVFSFAGEFANGSTAIFQPMSLPAPITFGVTELLQGTGQTGFGNGGTEIWTALNFSDAVTSVGDNNQFELVNAAGQVIATSNLVQNTLPSNAQVLGIDDANLDGTTGDNVIEALATRLFARFTLADGDDAINSDATWSDDGQDDINNRATRSAISVRMVDGFVGNVATNAIGGALDPDSSSTLGDRARPFAIGFLTRAGDTGDFCEFVDSLDVIFDETVQTNANTGSFSFFGYRSGETISDLTTGLGAGLSIPTIDIVTTATVNDRRLTPSSLALRTSFASNDTARANAPAVPVDGTANDGSTSILTGTGDEGYIFAHRRGAVSDANGRGAVALGTFNMANELTGGFVTVQDGAAPALMAANVVGDEISAGFSEDVNLAFPNTGEAESYFFIMENTSVGRRVNLSGADIDFVNNNIIGIEDVFGLDSDFALDPGYLLSVFNPGFPITDNAGNRVDPNIAKTKMVLITPPAAGFKPDGVALVDDANDKVIEILLKVTGPVELSSGGTLTALADRFYIRGDDFGTDNGESLTLGNLLEDIEISDEPDSDGCYTVTLFLMDGMPFPQEDFYVQYVDTNDQSSPAASFLVTPTDNGELEIASASIYVSVLRPPVVEGVNDNRDGNPLTMTIVGSLNLNGRNALGSTVTAYIWDANSGVGTASFVYKGVVHTLQLDGVANGEVRYFHPQLLGSGIGSVEPMGILNRKPELDITATVILEQNGQDVETLVYQELNNLGVPAVIRPIQVTFRTDPTCPGRFTFTGPGITNGRVTYPGGFTSIGSTVVTSPVLAGQPAEIGARPYTLHTRGAKSYNGRPVVIVVEPEDFFAPGADCFLANNFVANRLTFTSDINRTGANATPRTFNINRGQITRMDLDDYEFGDWAILPVLTNQGDFGAAGNLPNRVSTGNTPVTTTATFPTGTDARGAFVVLNGGCTPELLSISTALAIDNRGVYCGDICLLNRVASGYAYAVEAGNLNGRTWYTFGPRFTSGQNLSVVTNNTNGGWNLLANLRNAPITPTSASTGFGGTINITMNDANGVRIWANGFTEFNDLSSIGTNEGVLVFTPTNFVSTP